MRPKKVSKVVKVVKPKAKIVIAKKACQSTKAIKKSATVEPREVSKDNETESLTSKDESSPSSIDSSESDFSLPDPAPKKNVRRKTNSIEEMCNELITAPEGNTQTLTNSISPNQNQHNSNTQNSSHQYFQTPGSFQSHTLASQQQFQSQQSQQQFHVSSQPYPNYQAPSYQMQTFQSQPPIPVPSYQVQPFQSSQPVSQIVSIPGVQKKTRGKKASSATTTTSSVEDTKIEVCAIEYKCPNTKHQNNFLNGCIDKFPIKEIIGFSTGAVKREDVITIFLD